MPDMIQTHDEPVLVHLTNVEIGYQIDSMSYVFDMRCTVHQDVPFNFEGPEIFKCPSYTIQRNPSMNVKVKTIKKQIYKQRGEDDKNVEDETQMLLASGKSSCARIIPKAILYHTGELMDENDEGEEEDELPQSA
ncbi:nucleosome assembly protein [Culex quinquefasciatus]|uniref:Nucleosome assembly protein n=1 Tax=Culex quinquefasciatus TaxID=7176 RepID=B0X4D8_CULQU|nr:nucleosome assembly protein [Culex quinquefasciatus]|eukprot:XP_001864510.1 nucleosome assembly protein [Culex quinquefasciatus]